MAPIELSRVAPCGAVAQTRLRAQSTTHAPQRPSASSRCLTSTSWLRLRCSGHRPSERSTSKRGWYPLRSRGVMTIDSLRSGAPVQMASLLLARPLEQAALRPAWGGPSNDRARRSGSTLKRARAPVRGRRLSRRRAGLSRRRPSRAGTSSRHALCRRSGLCQR